MLRILKYPGRILTIIRQILRDYVFVGSAYYPIGLFVVASILFIVIIIVVSIYKKNLYILLLGIICYGSIFVLSLPQGDALPYRSNLMIALLVAMVLFYLTYVILKCRYQLINVIGMVLVISVVYNSAFDLNHWFAFGKVFQGFRHTGIFGDQRPERLDGGGNWRTVCLCADTFLVTDRLGDSGILYL